MNCRKNIIKLIAIITATVFLTNTVAWAAPSFSTQSVSPQLLEDIFIPESYGRLEQISDGKLQIADKTVVLIRDAHCVYEAQKNIEDILDILIKDYEIDLVCVEGAVSKVDTSRLGSYKDQEARRKVADKYTKNGLFTASEALSIKKGLNPGFNIYGVEDAGLYWKDFQAFRNTVGVSKVVDRFLGLMESVIVKLKNKLYSEELREFDNEAIRYRNNEALMTEWIKFLAEQCTVHSLQFTDNKKRQNFDLVCKAIELEEKIDFKKVETERAALIKELENNLVKEELKELVRNSLLFKLGKLPAVDYYTYLERLGGQVEENLKNYIELVKLQSGIDEAGLFKELDLLQESIYQDLIPDEVARNLYQLDKNLNILDKVMHLKATREDLIYYERNRDKFTPDRLLNFVKIQAPLNGISIHNELNSPLFLKEVEQAMVPSAEFYELALRRDRALVDNLIRRMNNEKKDRAVLVCGGFHSEGITDMLKEKDINVITISPSITKVQEDSQKIYLSRMMDKRINPEEIIRDLGLENLGAPIAFDTPLGDLLVKDPTKELQVLCEAFGINAEGITVGELLGREVPDERCSVKEILISRYLKGDNPLFSSFLEENVLPVLSEELREEVRSLKKMKQKLDVYLEKRRYWDAWRLIGEVRRSYPRIILEVFEKEFSEISKRIIELSGDIKKSVNEKEFEKLGRCYEEIYKLDPYAFFRASEYARYARRRMEQLDEYISAQRDISRLIEHKGLEESICRLIDEKRYVTVYAIVCSIVEENDVFSSLSSKTCHKLLALVRIMYQEMNIGSLVDKEYSILYKVQKALVADAVVISRYSNEFNKAYEERFQDIPEGLKRGRELLGKAEEGLLEKWHTTVLLKDRLKLMMHIAEEESADELGYLKNLLALVTVYFKDSYNMDLGVFFGDPQKLIPPTTEHPDFNRLIEETADNYRKVIENLVNFDSIASSLGRESLNLYRLVVVKKDVMSVNRWERIVQLNIETKTVEKRNFYQFSRHLTHEYGHLFHFVNLPDGFPQIDRQKLEDFIRRWGIDIEITDEADLGSIACEIINYLYKKKLGMWKEATDEWIRLFPDRYKDVAGRQGYKEKRKALDQGRKEFLQDRFGFKWEKYPSEPSVPALTLFHMFERSPYETMGSSVVEIEPEFKEIPYRDEDEPWEFFAEFFQLYILHPEVLRKIDEEIYELMQIIVGDVHLKPEREGFNIEELGGKYRKKEGSGEHRHCLAATWNKRFLRKKKRMDIKKDLAKREEELLRKIEEVTLHVKQGPNEVYATFNAVFDIEGLDINKGEFLEILSVVLSMERFDLARLRDRNLIFTTTDGYPALGGDDKRNGIVVIDKRWNEIYKKDPITAKALLGMMLSHEIVFHEIMENPDTYEAEERRLPKDGLNFFMAYLFFKYFKTMDRFNYDELKDLAGKINGADLQKIKSITSEYFQLDFHQLYYLTMRKIRYNDTRLLRRIYASRKSLWSKTGLYILEGIEKVIGVFSEDAKGSPRRVGLSASIFFLNLIVYVSAILIILFLILPRKPDVEQIQRVPVKVERIMVPEVKEEKGGETQKKGQIWEGLPNQGQKEVSLRVLYGGRLPIYKDIGKMLQEWKERRLKRKLTDKEQKQVEESAMEYRQKGIYNPSPQDLENICGRIGGLLAPLMKDLAWPGFSEEQMKILLEALLETESDNRQWIIREVDGKPIVYVLGSVKGAYGISQITRIAVQELGKVVYDDLNTISSSDPKGFAYKMAERRLKAIYLLLFANDYSFDAYSKLSIDWVIKHFKTIPNEEGEGRKDFNPFIDASWNLWEYNIRASAAIILTTFDYFIENYGEYKDGNYPIWRWTIAAYNWSKYGMLRACKEDKDLCISQTSELSVDTERYQKRHKELSGVSIEDEDFCKLPPLVKELVKGVYKDAADGRFGAARVIINKIDWSLRKFTEYAKKKKLDLEEVKGFLGITTVRDWNRYIKEGYTLSQILHAEIKKRERSNPESEGRISRGIESELEARRNLESPYVRITDIGFSRESNVDGLVEKAFSDAQGKADEIGIDPKILSGVLEEAKELFKRTPKAGFNMVAVRSRNVNCKDKEEEDFYCGGYAWSRKRNRYEFQYAEEIMWEARSYDRENGTSLFIEYLFHEALCHVLRQRFGERGHAIARDIQKNVFSEQYRHGNVLGRIIRENINRKVLKEEMQRAKDFEKEHKYSEALKILYRIKGFSKDMGTRCEEERQRIQKHLLRYKEIRENADRAYSRREWADAEKGYYEVIMSGVRYEEAVMDEIRNRFMECGARRVHEINAEGKSDKTYREWVSALDKARKAEHWKRVAEYYAKCRRENKVSSEILALMDERLCLQIKRYIVSAYEFFTKKDYEQALRQMSIAVSLIPEAKFQAAEVIFDHFIQSLDLSILQNFTKKEADAMERLIKEMLKGWYDSGLSEALNGEFGKARDIFRAIEELVKQPGYVFVFLIYPEYSSYIGKMKNHMDTVMKNGLFFSHGKPNLAEKANIIGDFAEWAEILDKEDKEKLCSMNSAEELKSLLSEIKIWTPVWEEIIKMLSTQPYPYLIDEGGKRKKAEYEALIRFILKLAEEHPDFKPVLLDLKEAVQNYVNSVDTPTLGGIINDANRGVFCLSAEEKRKVEEGIKTVGDIKRIVEGFVSYSVAWREIFNIVIQKIQEFQGKKSQESAIDIEEVIGIKRIVESKAISEIVKNRLILNLLALTKNIHILNKFSDSDLEYIIEAIEQFPGELLRILGDPIDLSNASLEEHILGLSYGGRVVIDAGKHRERDIKDTVWHELIHEASLSYYYDWRYEKKMPTIPADIWEKIAVNSGFIGYLCDNKKRFEFTRADQSYFDRFGKIDRTDWVFWDGDRLVDYVPEKDYENIGEVVGGKRYILIPYEDIGEALKGKGYRFEIIKKGGFLEKNKYVAIEVRKDSEGRMSHSRLSPCEFVAYAGAAYIRNSDLEELRRDSLYKGLYGLFKKSNIFEYLGEYLFAFVDDAGNVVRYEYKEGKRSKVVPVVDPARKKGAKPLANRGPRGYRGQGASMVLSESKRREVMSRFGVKMPDIKVENCKAKKDMYIGCEYIEFVLDNVGNVTIGLTYHIDSGLYSLSYKVGDEIKIWGELKPGMTIEVGRGDKNDIQLSNRYVSKEHLEIVVSEEQIVVRDLGSHNGTRVIEKKADAHKVPGTKGIYDEDSDADIEYIASQLEGAEERRLDSGQIESLLKVYSELRERISEDGLNNTVFHIIESKELGIRKHKDAKKFTDLLPALGSRGEIIGYDEETGRFKVKKGDNRLHIYVTEKYWEEVLSRNSPHLAETIDHEWAEHIVGKTHREAAARARFFVPEGTVVSPYHRFIIEQIICDDDMEHLEKILKVSLEERMEGLPEVLVKQKEEIKDYEEVFREYVLLRKKIIERGLSDTEVMRWLGVMFSKERGELQKNPRFYIDSLKAAVCFVDDGLGFGNIFVEAVPIAVKKYPDRIQDVRKIVRRLVDSDITEFLHLFIEMIMDNTNERDSVDEYIEYINSVFYLMDKFNKISDKEIESGNFNGLIEDIEKGLEKILPEEQVVKGLADSPKTLYLLQQGEKLRKIILIHERYEMLERSRGTLDWEAHDRAVRFESAYIYKQLKEKGEEDLNLSSLRWFRLVEFMQLKIAPQDNMTENMGVEEAFRIAEVLKKYDLIPLDMSYRMLRKRIFIRFMYNKLYSDYGKKLKTGLLIFHENWAKVLFLWFLDNIPDYLFENKELNIQQLEDILEKIIPSLRKVEYIQSEGKDIICLYLYLGEKEYQVRFHLRYKADDISNVPVNIDNIELHEDKDNFLTNLLGTDYDVIEEVISEIMDVLGRRGITNIGRDRVRGIVIEAKEIKEKVKIQELLDLVNKTGLVKPEELFELAYEISMPLKKLFPREVLERSGQVVANILKGILESAEGKRAEDSTEVVKKSFFDTVRKALEQIGMTDKEIENDRELIEKALDMIELYPLIDAELNPGCFDLIKQISGMCGVTETGLAKAFSDSGYGRYRDVEKLVHRGSGEVAGDSRLSRAVRRLKLYQWIKVKGIKGVVNITDLETRSNIKGTEGVFSGVDFGAVKTDDSRCVVEYISGNAVVQEEVEYIYDKLKRIVVGRNGETFGEVLNGETPLFTSIPEEVFIDIEKSDKKSITYSPGLTAFFRLMKEAKNPNVRVEIRTSNIDALKDIIKASRVPDNVTVAGEFNNREEILNRQESLKKEYGIHSVFVLGKGQERLGEALRDEIVGNDVKVFCAENMALHAVLLFGALQAAAGEMFSDMRYSDEGKNVIESLTLFGVSKERIAEIIEKNIPFFIIRTEEIIRQFRLQCLTIDMAA